MSVHERDIVCLLVCVCVYVVRERQYISVCERDNVYVSVHMCIYVCVECVCMCVECVYVCVYVCVRETIYKCV